MFVQGKLQVDIRILYNTFIWLLHTYCDTIQNIIWLYLHRKEKIWQETKGIRWSNQTNFQKEGQTDQESHPQVSWCYYLLHNKQDSCVN